MKHLTLTGQYAGKVLCLLWGDCYPNPKPTKADLSERGDTFAHAAYLGDDALRAESTCPHCLKVWDAADDTE